MIFGHTSKEGWLHLSKSSPKTFPQAKICSSKLVPSLACPDDDNDDDGVDDDDDDDVRQIPSAPVETLISFESGESNQNFRPTLRLSQGES